MERSSKLHSTNTNKPMVELLSSSANPSSFTTNYSSTTHNLISSSTNMENLSFEVSKYFLGGKSLVASVTDDEVDDDDDDDDDDKGVNLGLGLSLGGKFRVDKTHKGLIRSSCVARTMPLLREDDAAAAPQRRVSTLGRTASLPVETEEEWKRKEMQTLRRMETKRRRSEKQRVLKEGGGGEKGVERMKYRGRLEREQQSLGITSMFIGSSMGSLFGSATPPTLPPPNVEVKGRRSTFGSLQGFLIAQGQVQQGSGESQGCGTSLGASELESKIH